MDFVCVKDISEISKYNCDSLIISMYKPDCAPFVKTDPSKVLNPPVCTILKLPNWAKSLEGEFDASASKMSLLRKVQIEKNTFEKVLLLGLGEKKLQNDFLNCSYYATAFSTLKSLGAKNIALMLHDSNIAQRCASQLFMADYSFSKYKSDNSNKPNTQNQYVNTLVFVSNSDISKQVLGAKIFAQSANLCRSIQNEPANIATIKYVCDVAQDISRKSNLKYKILQKKDLQKENMNAMLAVAQGSTNEPALLVLEYIANPKSKQIDLAIVGKGVIFDSGGISLKPSDRMDEMKFDKSGACVVISVMSALKQLGIKKNIVAIAPLVENMPSGNAYRPGDIIRASNSKTIEVLNTDAEGRLILADALAYTCRKYSPQTLIDLATLTGACSVALGDLASAILCDDEKLCSDLISCSHNSNERLWQLPSWSEYDDKIKSDVADIKNTGEKGMAGTIAGYSFLKNFVDCPSWAHIDIAGTANIKTPKWGLCAGGTGFGVRLCLEYITQKL